MGQGGPRGRHQAGVRPNRTHRYSMISDMRSHNRCSLRINLVRLTVCRSLPVS
jgi:hypothetical protein